MLLQGGAHSGRLQEEEVPPADGQADRPTDTQARGSRSLPGAASALMSCLRGFGQQHRSGRGAGAKPLKWRV